MFPILAARSKSTGYSHHCLWWINHVFPLLPNWYSSWLLCCWIVVLDKIWSSSCKRSCTFLPKMTLFTFLSVVSMNSIIEISCRKYMLCVPMLCKKPVLLARHPPFFLVCHFIICLILYEISISSIIIHITSWKPLLKKSNALDAKLDFFFTACTNCPPELWLMSKSVTMGIYIIKCKK